MTSANTTIAPEKVFHDEAVFFHPAEPYSAGAHLETREKEGEFAPSDRWSSASRRELREKANPQLVSVHDFPDENVPKAVPYGVYELAENEAWVSVGISHDTAQFAVEAIRQWYFHLGLLYPFMKKLLLIADSGGSNGYRLRLWKWELQNLANEIGIAISVCHLPSGTSKWNKIEHRLFSFITQNWRGKPLVTYQVIVEMITTTTTKTGLKVYSRIDENTYPSGIRITDKQMEQINLHPDNWHGEWNYTIYPISESNS